MAERLRGADLLARFLERHNIKQYEVAEGIGVSAPVIVQWLTGHRAPRIDHAKALAEYTCGEVPIESWATRRNTPVKPFAR